MKRKRGLQCHVRGLEWSANSFELKAACECRRRSDSEKKYDNWELEGIGESLGQIGNYLLLLFCCNPCNFNYSRKINCLTVSYNTLPCTWLNPCNKS